MNRLSAFKSRLWTGAGLVAVAAAFYAASLVFVAGADTKAADATSGDPKSADKKAADIKPEKKTEKKKLTGSELYAINCNRCHAERYATEFTSAQWKTLMTHMRVRANLPAAQAKQILKYLQEDSGN
jgi:mono/diheme cytochrome c family protein